MKTKNIFAMLLAVCMLLFLAMPAQAAKVEMIFWFSVPREYVPLMKELVEEFNKEKPHYDVKARNFESQEELLEKLLTGNVHPDIALINVGWQRELISSGKLENVEDIMNKVGTSIRVVFKMDTFPSLWAASLHEEKLWSVPFYGLNQVILYNPQILKNNKIKAPPKTWKELIDTGKKLSQKGVYSFAIPLDADDKKVAYIFNSVLMQAGGSFNNMNSSEYEQTLKLCRDLLNQKIITTDGFDSDDLAMFVGTPEDYFRYKKGGIFFKASPMLRGKAKVSVLEQYNLAIFKNGKLDPMKAWNFVYWLSEFPQSLKWTLQTPYLPANKQVTLSPEYFQYLQDNPEITMFLKELASAKAETELNNYEKTMKNIGENIKKALKE